MDFGKRIKNMSYKTKLTSITTDNTMYYMSLQRMLRTFDLT